MAATVVLHKHILEEFILHNETAEQKSGSIPMKPEIRFQVFPQKDKQPIVTQMSVEIGNMDDNSPLYIKLRVRGLFITVAQDPAEAMLDAKEFHRQAFLQLFNCARTMIAGAMLMGGMAPLTLPSINPGNLDIHKNN